MRSQDLAVEARDSGFFDREIVPVELPDGTIVDKDDGPRPGTTLEKLAELKPVFREGGTVTAGNACPLNDGAAAVLLMSADRAKELGLKPRARVIASATSGNEPEYMGVAPIGAIQNVLEAHRHVDRRHRRGRAERGVRRPGHPDHERGARSRSRSSTRTAGRSRSGTRSARPARAS